MQLECKSGDVLRTMFPQAADTCTAQRHAESDSDTSSDDEDIDAEKAELLDTDQQLLGQQLDQGRPGMQTRVSVRNLRIREDTAKYLRNLDVKSAFYDPKTRSMRSNPNPEKAPEELDYAGDNFVRYTGDTRKIAEQQLYEFAAYERGQNVHMLAMPTQVCIVYQQTCIYVTTCFVCMYASVHVCVITRKLYVCMYHSCIL